MLRFAKNNPSIDICFSEHPSLRQRIRQGDVPITIAEFEDFLQNWNSLPNTYNMHNDPRYINLMQGSDVVLTDGLSPLLEAQIILKPLIFFEREGHLSFNKTGAEISSGWHTVHDVKTAFKLASDLKSHGDTRLENQQKNRSHWTSHLDSARLITDDILKLLN